LPITAYRLPLIVSSALVVEVVFDLPGLGESLLSALIQQDTPMILSIILISVLFVQVCVFLADIMAFVLHPQRSSG
jgi:peptide/nickel transport system permease protein